MWLEGEAGISHFVNKTSGISKETESVCSNQVSRKIPHISPQPPIILSPGGGVADPRGNQASTDYLLLLAQS